MQRNANTTKNIRNSATPSHCVKSKANNGRIYDRKKSDVIVLHSFAFSTLYLSVLPPPLLCIYEQRIINEIVQVIKTVKMNNISVITLLLLSRKILLQSTNIADNQSGEKDRKNILNVKKSDI